MTIKLVETIEVGSGGAASIEFTNIPQTGVDLVVKLSARTSSSNNNDLLTLLINGDTGSNYATQTLRGTGSGLYKNVWSSSSYMLLGMASGSTATSNTFSNQEIYISNYTSSSAKSVSTNEVNENNATEAYQVINAASWSGTTAITSLKFKSGAANNFSQYSTASLYIIS